MNRKCTQRRLALLLALTFIFSLCSCGETSAPTGDGNIFSTFSDEAESATKTDSSINTEAQGELEKQLDEAEMIDVVKCWVGFSDRGVLDTPDSSRTVVVKTKEDLAPYRSYLTELTEEEEQKLLADKNGYCMLLEITAKSDRHYCDISSISNYENAIEIHVSEFEEEDPFADPQPLHSFYLFYFPAEVYHGEPVTVLFDLF